MEHESEASCTSQLGNVAYIQKLKAISKRHVNDMEGRSNETYKTEEETPSYNIDEVPDDEFQGCSILPDIVSSVKNFDFRKYTPNFGSSVTFCTTKACVDGADLAENKMKIKKPLSTQKKPRDIDERTRNRRKEREDRASEFNCSDVIIDDNFSISEVSGITMHTLRVQNFQSGLSERKMKKKEEEPDDNHDELQRIKDFFISGAGEKNICGEDMTFETAVSTLRTISRKLDVPVKDLLNDQGFTDYLKNSEE